MYILDILNPDKILIAYSVDNKIGLEWRNRQKPHLLELFVLEQFVIKNDQNWFRNKRVKTILLGIRWRGNYVVNVT